MARSGIQSRAQMGIVFSSVLEMKKKYALG
jgi:hypothetical protein